ncbi:MAG: tetratricopeptide repeat protein [Candidatus Scalindua sp.]|nr:tetratricopeptide repeat protein [Candidatus Scalindua sp.]
MNTSEKKPRKNKSKKWKFWLIFVAAPIFVVILSSLAIYGVSLRNRNTGKQGLEKGRIYANLHRHTEAIEEFKKELINDPENAGVHYYMGRSLFRLKEYEKAISELKSAIRIRPDFTDAYTELAAIHFTEAIELRKLGKSESLVIEKLLAAGDVCVEILEKNPELTRVHILLGDIHTAQGLNDDAIKDYNEALKIDNSVIDAHTALVRLYIANGNLDLAEKQCNTALSVNDPVNYQILLYLASIYEQHGKFEESIGLLERILEKKPDDLMAHTQLSILYLETLRYDEALREAEKVFKLGQSVNIPPIVYFVKGSVLLQKKEYTTAIFQLRKATEKLPRFAHAHYFLALALAENDQIEEAKTEFNAAIDIAPSFLPAQIGLARLLTREGWHKESIKLCKNVLDLDPENVDAMQIIGMAYIETRDFKSAEKQFKDILKLKPSVGDINLAYLSLVSGQLSKCIRQCEAIITINPEEANACDILGLAHIRQGEFDKGIEQFKKVVEIVPGSINTYINLAKAYVLAGKNEEAIKSLEKLISIDPDNVNALMILANIYVNGGDIDKATTTFEKVLAVRPDYLPAYALASLYLLQGRIDESIGLFNRALKIDPENALLYTDFAVAYQQAEKRQASILYGQKAIELKKEVPSFRIIMANIYAANGEVTKAKEQVESILMLNDDEKKEYSELIDLCRKNSEKGKQATLALNKAIVARQRGFSPAAIQEFTSAAKIFPENIIAKIFLADTYLSLNQKEQAIKVYTEIINSKPEFVSSYDYLGKAYLMAQKQDEAIAAFHDVIKMDDKSVTARLNLAGLLLKRGSTDDAARMIGEVMELEPDNLLAHNLLGEINLVNERYGKAEEEFSTIFKFDRETDIDYLNIAKVTFAQDDFDKCVEHCKIGLRLNPSNISLHNILGAAYIKKGMLDKAAAEFNTIIDINSDFIPAYLNLAHINLRINQPDIANLQYKTALKIDPDNFDARLGLGNSYALMGNHQAAIDECKNAINSYPTKVELYISLAESYLALDKNSMATEVVMKALDQEPENQIARALLSKIYMMNDNIPEAINQLNIVLVDNPHFIDAYRLGILYLDIGQYDDSIALYKQGVENFPDNALLWCNLAIAYIMNGDDKNAEKACSQALIIEPDGIIPGLCMVTIHMIKGESASAAANLHGLKQLDDSQKKRFLDLIEFCRTNSGAAHKAVNHLSRSIAYTNNKWFKRALREYDELSKIVPSNTLAYHAQADVLIMLGEDDRALEICNKIRELEPQSSSVYTKLAGIYNRMGQPENAEVQYKKLITIDPSNAAAYLNLGILQESMGTLEEAAASYNKVIELQPSSPIGYNNLAFLYATKMAGKLEDALVLGKKAKELAPKSPAVIDTLGWIYYLNGLFDEAIAELETAVKGIPWNPTVRYHLGMAYYKKKQLTLSLSELEQALKISNTFPEADEAREVMEKIKPQ